MSHIDERTDADVICIGFGPANIALAVAICDAGTPLRAIFLERNEGPAWQEEMLLPESDIQNSPFRDLVTPCNPRSRYTFLNFLHEQGRLYKHLNLGLEFPFRAEFSRYVEWVAENVPVDVRYSSPVASVAINEDHPDLATVRLDSGTALNAPMVVVATGRTVNVPDTLSWVPADRLSSVGNYLSSVNGIGRDESPSFAVVGGSQSGVEMILDLHARFPRSIIHSVIRGFGYHQKDVSPFMEEAFFPSHIDYYFEASEARKRALDAELRVTNYSAADLDVIQRLYRRMYEDELNGSERIRIHRSSEVTSGERRNERLSLKLRDVHAGTHSEITVDRVVLATGFLDLGGDGERTEFLPDLFAGLRDHVVPNDAGGPTIDRDYKLALHDENSPGIFLSGLCESSHGLGDAGSFSTVAARASRLLSSLATFSGREHPAHSIAWNQPVGAAG